MSSNSLANYIDKELYGGAIVSKLPSDYADASKFREIPDHQEVFMDNATNASLIVELFDYESELSDSQAIRHYFDDLAQANEATHYVVLSDKIVEAVDVFAPLVSQEHSRIVLIGQQSVSKFRTRPDSVVDEVYIILVLIRLKNVGTDLLISLNIPITDSELECKAPDFDSSLLHPSMLLELENCELFQSIYKALPAIEVLKNFVNWFNVRDWSLFNGSSN